MECGWFCETLHMNCVWTVSPLSGHKSFSRSFIDNLFYLPACSSDCVRCRSISWSKKLACIYFNTSGFPVAWEKDMPSDLSGVCHLILSAVDSSVFSVMDPLIRSLSSRWRTCCSLYCSSVRTMQGIPCWIWVHNADIAEFGECTSFTLSQTTGGEAVADENFKKRVEGTMQGHKWWEQN